MERQRRDSEERRTEGREAEKAGVSFVCIREIGEWDESRVADCEDICISFESGELYWQLLVFLESFSSKTQFILRLLILLHETKLSVATLGIFECTVVPACLFNTTRLGNE